MVCSICTHDKIKEINRALLGGWTVKSVAVKFELNLWSARKHWRRHLPWKDRHARPAGTVDEQMEDLKLELRRLQILAECGDNVLGPLTVLKQRQSLLELEMRKEHLLGATHKKLFPPPQDTNDHVKVIFEN